MKVDEQVKLLNSARVSIAVGTPARLSELVENGKHAHPHYSSEFSNVEIGALVLDGLHRIVVDASHIDQKKRGVLDMKDTMLPLARFISKKQFQDRYVSEEKPLSLLFF